jgi:sterol desaturase/sphingolipid hydroxylase (fatty acid hydroxylase superfamily)
MNTPNFLLYSTPLFIIAIGMEYLLSRESGLKLYTKKDFLTNVGFAAGSAISGGVATSYYLAFYYVCFHFFEPYRETIFHYSSLGWGWKIWLFSLLADDFTYYWFHRSSHTIRLFWACHVVHHSSEHYNLSTAIRNGWFCYAYKPLFWIWLAIIGVHPVMILACLAINTSYGFFCHTTMLPWWDKLSRILVTPGLHAIHHGQEDRSIDKNFAGVFIFYDRLMGTYEPIIPSRQVIFGVTKPPRSDQFQEVMIHEFRDLFIAIKNAPSWKIKLSYLFRKPGWSPGKVEN